MLLTLFVLSVRNAMILKRIDICDILSDLLIPYLMSPMFFSRKMWLFEARLSQGSKHVAYLKQLHVRWQCVKRDHCTALRAMQHPSMQYGGNVYVYIDWGAYMCMVKRVYATWSKSKLYTVDCKYSLNFCINMRLLVRYLIMTVMRVDHD